VRRPAAFVGIDKVVLGELLRPPGDPWEQIPLAYELLLPRVRVLLERGWTVIYESTFTLVPVRGEPQLHLDRLEELESLARELGRPFTIVQLASDPAVLRKRVEDDARLPWPVVEETFALQGAVELPWHAVRLDSSEKPASALAREIVASLA
jgi:predicted kinase